MLALLYPWIIVLLVVLAIGVAIWKKLWICGCLLLAAFTLNWYSECFALHLFSSSYDDSVYTIKVMTWNMNGEYYPEEKGNYEDRIALIKQVEPDVIYLAEDFWGIYMQVDSALKIDYPYSTFYRNTQHYLYSKLPIIESYGLVEKDEYASIEKISVKTQSGNLCVYGCHLSSNNYLDIKNDIREDTTKNLLMSYTRSIPYSSNLRTQQTIRIVENIKSCPTIVMGDLNDISRSSCMKVLADAGFNDAWWKGGLGFGTTIHHPLPFRIDHIMYNDGLKLKSIKKIDADGLSDHDALVAEFEIK